MRTPNDGERSQSTGSFMTDIRSIIQQMTLEEKAALCTGATAWSTTPIERLGVPEMVVSDGPHGVRRVEDVAAIASKTIPSTCFPTASSLASTWDVDLVHEMGQALGDEAIALHVDVLLGPGANMKRTPLCGRNFEYFSEDPYQAGQLAASLIQGIQSKGVGTSLKHFALNNQEYRRLAINVVVDERALREIYLPAFETAVKKAKPWTVMCAYNKANGTLCSQNHRLLEEILKQEWGFEGLVVSDWGAVRDRVAALSGGLDLEMPGPRDMRVQKVIEAVRAGELDEAVLDETVRRILSVVFKAAETPKGGAIDVEGHHALARCIAADGMVLLKNNGVLPLDHPQRIAVIGRAAKEPYFQGGGSSRNNPTKLDVPLDELRLLAGAAELTYCDGYPARDAFRQDLIDEAVEAARSAEVALLYISLPATKEAEGYDRPDLDLTEQQIALIQAVTRVQPRNVIILNNGSAITMGAWIDGAGAVLEAWMMGQAGGGAIADILFGKVNPSGKLAETFPQRLEDTPAFINFPGENGDVRYGEGLFIGYRYYDAKAIPVLFPFGYGGSYTTFAYSSPRVSAAAFNAADGLTVSVDVTNTGKLAGKEIVQVYVHDRKSSLVRPPKELKGFAKVALQPGETKTVTIALDERAFAFYHPGYQRWIVEDGDFDILIGASSADIRFTETVTLRSNQVLPSILDCDSTLRDWLADPHRNAASDAVIQKLRSQMAHQWGLDETEDQILGMDLTNFMLDMPLINLLDFSEDSQFGPADEMVDALLAQVHGDQKKQVTTG
jgi:beta-glucosidase